MRLILVIGIVILALVAGLLLEIRRELHTFRVSRYTVHSEKLSGLAQDVQLVFLSDLHNHVYGENNRRLLDAIQNEHPDLILIGGDMLVGKETIPYDTAFDFVSHLSEIAPVLYANGNHEQRMKEEPEKYVYSYQEYKQALEKKGIHFLENESCTDQWTGNSENDRLKLEFTGLELPLQSYKKCKKYPVSVQLIEECLNLNYRKNENGYKFDTGNKSPLSADKTDESDIKYQDQTLSQCQKLYRKEGHRQEKQMKSYKVLLAHNPAYVDAYKEWGADLILCGHLHGGIVRIPGIGCIITPQFFLFPKYSGELTQEGNQTIVVSRGLGTHTVNLRLFNTAEVISLKLKK